MGDAVVGKQVSVGSLVCEAEIHTEKGTTDALSGTKRHNRYSKRQIDTEVHNTDSHLSGFCLGNSSDQEMRCRSTQKKSVMSSVEPSTCLTVSVSRPSVRVTRGAIAKSLLSNNRAKIHQSNELVMERCFICQQKLNVHSTQNPHRHYIITGTGVQFI